MSGLLHDVPSWYEDPYDSIEETVDEDGVINGMMELPSTEEIVMQMVKQRKNLQAEKDALAQRIKELTVKKRQREKQIEWLTDGALLRMEAMEIDKIKTPEYTVTVRQNADKIEVVNEDDVPDAFKKTVVSIAKAVLNKFVKDGNATPPGCKIISGGSSLSVR